MWRHIIPRIFREKKKTQIFSLQNAFTIEKNQYFCISRFYHEE